MESSALSGSTDTNVMATLIDTATFWAVYMRLPEDSGLVNVDIKLNYLRPVTKGPLIARGECIKSGRSLSYAQASIFDTHNAVCAHGTSTLMALPGQGIKLKNSKFIDL